MVYGPALYLIHSSPARDRRGRSRRASLLVAATPRDGDLDDELAADGVDRNGSLLVGRVNGALGVHVENRSATTAGRPREDAGVGVNLEVITVSVPGARNGVGELDLVLAGEIEEGVDGALHATGERGKAPGSSLEDGELEAGVELHVDGKLAVLAPFAGRNARAGLGGELGEGGLEQASRGINRDIGRAGWAAGSQKPDLVDPDLLGPVPAIEVGLGVVASPEGPLVVVPSLEAVIGARVCGKSGGDAEEEGESSLPVHVVG